MEKIPNPRETLGGDVPTQLIRLADGNGWGFARQTRRLIPSVVEGVDVLGRRTETIAVRPGFGYPLEIQRLVDDFGAACDQDSMVNQYQAFFAMAIALLCRAHEIDRSTACILLSVEDEELPRLITEVLSVAFDIHPGPGSGPEEGQTDG